MASSNKSVLNVVPAWATGPKDTQTKLNEKIAALSGGSAFKLFSTTLTLDEILSGTKEAKNAEKASVSLIGVRRPFGPQENAKTDDWLNVTPHCYFRSLPKEAKNVHVIIAHGPNYYWGALNIKDAFYPTSKVILFNHAYPEENLSKVLKKDIRDAASNADLVVSFDEDTYSKYEALYETAVHVIHHQQIDINHLSAELLLNLKASSKDVSKGGKVTPKKVEGTPKKVEPPKQTKVSPKAEASIAAVTNELQNLTLTPAMRSKSLDCSWHNDITPSLKKFHDDHAKEPTEAIKRARPYFEATMKMVEAKLKDRKLCVRFEYTGSGYEHVMINELDVEFDLMVVMNEGTDLEATQYEDGTGGYFMLKPQADHKDAFSKVVNVDKGVIAPDKVVNAFFGALQKALNETDATKKTKLRKHGPAVQMDVYHDVDKTQKWFSVDIVPAYQIRKADNTQLFVAKPYKDAASSNHSWRRSFSVEEKAKFKDIDKGDGCRRMCIRILKAIVKPPKSVGRKPDSSFSHVTSFMLKNTLFHLNDDPSTNWSMKKLGPRTIQIISQMVAFVDSGNFPHYFLPGVNIVAGLEEGPRKNLADRWSRLVSSEVEFRRMTGSE